MKKFTKRLLASFVCLISVFAVMSPVNVHAAGPIDTEASCVLDLTFAPDSIPAAGLEFRLYKVASISYACRFTVVDRFKGFDLEDLLEEPDAGAYSLVTTTLSNAIAADSTILPDAVQVTDENGHAVFEGLEVGLYLVEGDIFHSGEYFYYPGSCLICLPERTEDDTWNYSVTATLKWDKNWDSEPVDLTVLKTWEDISVNLHRGEVIEIKLYKDGVLYDTKYLSSENDWTYTWTELYGGANWTIKETPVTNYKTYIVRRGNFFIVTNKPWKPWWPPEIPDTGMTWWPIPVLVGAGLFLAILALLLKKKKDNKDENK